MNSKESIYNYTSTANFAENCIELLRRHLPMEAGSWGPDEHCGAWITRLLKAGDGFHFFLCHAIKVYLPHKHKPETEPETETIWQYPVLTCYCCLTVSPKIH